MGNVCNAFYWLHFDDLRRRWPAIGATRCEAPGEAPVSRQGSNATFANATFLNSSNTSSLAMEDLPEGFACVPARYCTWTNNPVLFRRAFWLEMVAPQLRACDQSPTNYCLEVAQHAADIAAARPYVVALPARGLFEHYDPHKYKDFFLKYRLKEKRLAAAAAAAAAERQRADRAHRRHRR
eukprot:EG_transcript_27836